MVRQVKRDSNLRKVLQTLVDGPRTCIEIAEALDVVRGGSLTETLEVLVDAGFATKGEVFLAD